MSLGAQRVLEVCNNSDEKETWVACDCPSCGSWHHEVSASVGDYF